MRLRICFISESSLCPLSLRSKFHFYHMITMGLAMVWQLQMPLGIQFISAVGVHFRLTLQYGEGRASAFPPFLQPEMALYLPSREGAAYALNAFTCSSPMRHIMPLEPLGLGNQHRKKQAQLSPHHYPDLNQDPSVLLTWVSMKNLQVTKWCM